MNTLRLAAVLLATGGTFAWGAVRPWAQAAADRAVPFKVGEVLSYDVSWSTYLTAGTATMSVKERRASGASSVYDLVAEGTPTTLLDKLYHLYYKAETLLDTKTLQPMLSTVYSNERSRTKLRSMRFTGRTTYEFSPKTNAPFEKKTMPALALDPMAAVYVIRAIPLRAGQSFVMPIVDGPDTYNARWTIAGPEPITTPAGSFSAWRLTPALSDAQGKPVANRKVTLWMSDDARKLPIKLQAGLPVGNFVLTLTKIAG